jgi:hypothetical protein
MVHIAKKKYMFRELVREDVQKFINYVGNISKPKLIPFGFRLDTRFIHTHN